MKEPDPIFELEPRFSHNRTDNQSFNRLAQAVWETDASGVIVADSPSWRNFTGQTLQEWLGYGWLNAIHPDDRAYAARQWREAVATRALVDARFRLRSAAGGWCWTNVRAVPVLDAQGEVEKWIGINFATNAAAKKGDRLSIWQHANRVIRRIGIALGLNMKSQSQKKTFSRSDA